MVELEEVISRGLHIHNMLANSYMTEYMHIQDDFNQQQLDIVTNGGLGWQLYTFESRENRDTHEEWNHIYKSDINIRESSNMRW